MVSLPGWVGRLVVWVEENEAVRMSYCKPGLGGWVGGWVGGSDVPRLRRPALRKSPPVMLRRSSFFLEIWASIISISTEPTVSNLYTATSCRWVGWVGGWMIRLLLISWVGGWLE